MTSAMPAATWEEISSLTPWGQNPRINDSAVDHIAKSIERFGFGAPILARTSDRVVIAGHTRLKAALQMGLDKVPVRFLDLDPAEAAALALADNKLGELSEWDDELLQSVLSDLEAQEVDLDHLGWSEDELDLLLEPSQPEDDEPIDPDTLGEVPRHLTAPNRDSFSKSFQMLLLHGYLDGSLSFFDYGCGYGLDLRGAAALKLKAAGFDPHWNPGPKKSAEVVNLAFVLNVIEDVEERVAVLLDALGLAQTVLAVAVRPSETLSAVARVNDGVITSRGTFQKVHTNEELVEFLKTATKKPIETVASGVAFVFPTPEAHQDFKARKAILEKPIKEVIQ